MMNSDAEDPLDRLLKAAESRLDELESAEMLRSDDSAIEDNLPARQHGVFSIPALVDYLVVKELPPPSWAWQERLASLSWCEADELLAEAAHLPHREPVALIHPQSAEYIRFSIQNGTIQYTSVSCGYLVLVNNLLYLAPRNVPGWAELLSKDSYRADIQLFPRRGDGNPLTAQEVLRVLQEEDICFGIQEHLISSKVDEAEMLHQPLVLKGAALGISPIAGTDAKVHFKIPLHENQSFTILPDGRVDYRSGNTIPTAHEGDVLALLGVPGSGTPGMTIHGKTVEALPGKPNPLFAGEGVAFDSKTMEFRATRGGQISLNANLLCVHPHYIVQGDVDYRSGNIDFDGNVTVNGTLLMGFSIKATGDVIIRGNVESAVVECARDLMVFGGIVGEGSSAIKIGRNLQAQYLQNAWLECEGDVVVHNSLLHTRLATLGTVVVTEKKGAILGGKITALKGVVARSIGSAAGSITQIAVGQDYQVHNRMEELDTSIRQTKQGLDKLEAFLVPLLEKVEKGAVMEEVHKSRLRTILAKREELRTQLSGRKARRAALERAHYLKGSAFVTILGKVYPNTRIQVEDRSWVPDGEREHITLRVNAVDGELTVGPA